MRHLVYIRMWPCIFACEWTYKAGCVKWKSGSDASPFPPSPSLDAAHDPPSQSLCPFHRVFSWRGAQHHKVFTRLPVRPGRQWHLKAHFMDISLKKNSCTTEPPPFHNKKQLWRIFSLLVHATMACGCALGCGWSFLIPLEGLS
jgi:hypothetical protein